jgi:hypothetical protein
MGYRVNPGLMGYMVVYTPLSELMIRTGGGGLVSGGGAGVLGGGLARGLDVLLRGLIHLHLHT